MSRRGSEQVVFPDTSPCFSEEEWALLQQWQKDLYWSVMKEIHQALMSLGPLIATTVCSLSATEKEELCPKDRHNSSRRQRFHTAPTGGPVTSTGVLNKVRREDVVHLKNRKETARTEKNVCQRAESPIVVDDQCVTEEPGVIIIDPMGAEETDSTNQQNPASETGFPVVTAVFSLSINEEKTLFQEAPAVTFRADPVVNSQHAEETLLLQQVVGNSTGDNKRRDDQKPPKEKKGAHSKVAQPQQRRRGPQSEPNELGEQRSAGRSSTEDYEMERTAETWIKDTHRTDENPSQQQEPEPSHCSVQQGAGVKRKRRPKKIGYSIKGSEKIQPSKLVSRKKTTKKKHSSHMETNSTGQDWSLGGEHSVQCGSNANKLANFILSLGTPKIGISDTYGDCESNPSSSLVSNVPPTTNQEQPTHSSMKCDNSDSITAECSRPSEKRSRKTYACTECDKRFFSNYGLTEHCKMHAGEKTHECTECGKCFFTKSQLVRHLGVHSATKKYQCTFCPKAYDQKHNIDGHLRTHTGEKPYKCLECEKEFTWRSGFIMHQRRHHALRKAKMTI